MLPVAVPPDTVTGPGSGGQAGESPGSGDDCSPAGHKTAKGDLAVKHRMRNQTRSRERRRVPRPPGAVYAAVSSGPPRRPEHAGRHAVNLHTRPRAGPAVRLPGDATRRP